MTTDDHVVRHAKNEKVLLPGLLAAALRQAESNLTKRFLRLLAGHDLSANEFGILLLVHENQGLSQSDLGRAIASDRSTIVALVDRFEGRDLLLRTPSPFDRRSHALRLSPRAEQLMASLLPRLAAFERETLGRLNPAEQTQLFALLQKVATE